MDSGGIVSLDDIFASVQLPEVKALSSPPPPVTDHEEHDPMQNTFSSPVNDHYQASEPSEIAHQDLETPTPTYAQTNYQAPTTETSNPPPPYQSNGGYFEPPADYDDVHSDEPIEEPTSEAGWNPVVDAFGENLTQNIFDQGVYSSTQKDQNSGQTYEHQDSHLSEPEEDDHHHDYYHHDVEADQGYHPETGYQNAYMNESRRTSVASYAMSEKNFMNSLLKTTNGSYQVSGSRRASGASVASTLPRPEKTPVRSIQQVQKTIEQPQIQREVEIRTPAHYKPKIAVSNLEGDKSQKILNEIPSAPKVRNITSIFETGNIRAINISRRYSEDPYLQFEEQEPIYHQPPYNGFGRATNGQNGAAPSVNGHNGATKAPQDQNGVYAQIPPTAQPRNMVPQAPQAPPAPPAPTAALPINGKSGLGGKYTVTQTPRTNSNGTAPYASYTLPLQRSNSVHDPAQPKLAEAEIIYEQQLSVKELQSKFGFVGNRIKKVDKIRRSNSNSILEKLRTSSQSSVHAAQDAPESPEADHEVEEEVFEQPDPLESSFDKFNSVRVVRNVRAYVGNLNGQTRGQKPGLRHKQVHSLYEIHEE